MNVLISKIYIINLKSSIDRKLHIINEFNRVQIKDYEIFEAIDKDSQEVTDILNSDFVVKFPPCFRCLKNECNCDNNMLITHQIGNWCSFINIMKKIVENQYDNLIMICEDDIKFTDDWKYITDSLINEHNFKKYNIVLSKPLLIRLEQRGEHPLLSELKFTNNKSMSNACFVINKQYALSFLTNLKIINCTSDIYIHRNILLIDDTIQHFTAHPSPIYQLSDNKNAKFYSLIHPKCIDDYDIERNKIHIKRIEYKKFLCIGHPRCGTTSISYILNNMGYNVGHEYMGTNGISSWMLAVNDNDYPWGNIGLQYNNPIETYHFENIIHVIRNPFNAIPSIILENKYPPNNNSYNFRKKFIKNLLNIDMLHIIGNDEDNLTLIEEIELATKTYLYWNKICQLKYPTLIIKIENIDELDKFNKNSINLLNLNNIKLNSNKLFNGKKYDKPIIDMKLWNSISESIKNDLKDFCNKYNYDYILN
jgi:GR25 family glycosyltransferase involved in LPS biosynthesis